MWLAPALPLLVGGVLAGALPRRFATVAAQVVALAALGALLLLLGQASDASGDAILLGRPLAGVLILGLFSLAAQRVLGGQGGGGPLGAQAVAGGAATGALLAPDLATVYALATCAVMATWVAGLIDREVGPAGQRGAGRWLTATLVCDLGILASALGVAGARGLAVAAVARAALFPLQVLTIGGGRLPGRIAFGSSVVGGLVGVDLLGRALLLNGGRPGAGWLGLLAAATAVAGTVVLWRARAYPDALARSAIVDAAHIVAGLATGAPLGVAAALLYAASAALARTTLLGIADATSDRGRQLRRLPDGPALLPFGLGFGGLVGLPPQPLFVARWLVYLALFQGDAWVLALVLAVAAGFALAVLLRTVGSLGPPAQPRLAAQPLLLGLLLVWLPLGLFVVVPVVALEQLIRPAVARIYPGLAWSLGADTLLGVAGVVALLLAVGVVVLGFATYLGRLPRVFAAARRAVASPPLGRVRRLVAEVGVLGLPFAVLDGLGVLVSEGLSRLLVPWESRFPAAGIGAILLALLLLALG